MEEDVLRQKEVVSVTFDTTSFFHVEASRIIPPRSSNTL